MNSDTYTYLLANPQKINTENMKDLDAVVGKYPFFQSARALQLKGLKNENSFLYNDALKLTAAYTTDREILFEYITSNIFIQNEISEDIKQHDDSVKEIEVISEDVSAEISSKINAQIKEELKKAEAILNPNLFARKVESVEKIIDNDESTEVKSDLEIDKPLDFTSTDTHSFSEWLKLSSAVPIDRSDAATQSETGPDGKQRKFQLIEKFIQEKPKILRKKGEINEAIDKNEPLETDYADASKSLMTETLAKVYLQQMNYMKAIEAYHILILKNPEKSGFFADQIRGIQKLINTKE